MILLVQVKNIFDQHNQRMQEKYSSDRLLVYEVSQGWQPLCEFLDVDVPSVDFPHRNSSTEFQKRFLDG